MGRVGEGENGRWEKSSFFLLPTDIGLTSVTSVTSVTSRTLLVAELPTDIGLTSVTSVTSSESESVAELPS